MPIQDMDEDSLSVIRQRHAAFETEPKILNWVVLAFALTTIGVLCL